ncbi:hypothetical protein LTR47_011115 [Exophiala xenobiotica]|nr:hypothetical protein LTR47_011115 [Exophiala xenobiotica]KAK5252526.1 hypothetical protein LTS06_002933 [Exophiala xenobiotica]KAK5348311.1 hypothetical protein LTR61_008169 [Exophiala xenobiotica]KAK5362809.1 hypothetical protein LTR11_009499 [Exophiala xenobiotica]KAK5366116.1 hypothetical protein LTS03_008875 [Exophiala xenobiotica]
MPESLKVIALISGGKDSLFSILHCIKNGHTVVALANLHPRRPSTNVLNDGDDDEGEDINSFMYQTVGHSVIPLYSECLGIPLYRKEITGSAIQTGRCYDTSSTSIQDSLDETEDLIPLLQEVLREHPEANALCSGAILSTYQRTRVESVAVRLGLTPLAYLWQYPALPPPHGRADSLTGLLEDMLDAGCDARIIKIASGGIKESLLWSNVADPRTQARLVSGLRPFFEDHEFWLRGAALGEGGEYETLAINGPRTLWKKRIEVPTAKDSTIYGEGGVSYLRLGKARVVDNESASSDDESVTRQPQPFDAHFGAVLERLQTRTLETAGNGNVPDRVIDHDDYSSAFSNTKLQPSQSMSSRCLTVANMTAPITKKSKEGVGKAAGQMKKICEHLDSILKSISDAHNLDTRLTTSNIVSTTLLLKDMSDFAAVNSTYSSLFRAGEPNPPARVTISCQLPDDAEVSLSIILDLGPRDARRGLHVQSRSYWAPANIGPYSQAICVPVPPGNQSSSLNIHDAGLLEMVHMAGQIPLIPQSMLLTEGNFLDATVLSLQHLWRVGQERGVDIWPWGIAFLKQSSIATRHATTAAGVWAAAHSIGTRCEKPSSEDVDNDEDGLDAWDLRYNRFNSSMQAMTIGQHLHVLPNHNVFGHDTATTKFIPPFIAAEVVSLPKDAPIEWWSLGLASIIKQNIPTAPASFGRAVFGWGSIIRVSLRTAREDQCMTQETTVHLVTVFVHLAAVTGVVEAVHDIEGDLQAYLSQIRLSEQQSVSSPPAKPSLELIHGTAFLSGKGQAQWPELSRQEGLFNSLTVIPCKSVYGQSDFSVSIDDESVARQSSKSLDPSAEAGPNSPGPNVTAFNNHSAPCQPLAIALTMRIDSTSSR